MNAPTEQQQIEFLLKLQRLVTDGAGASKSSSYKFALLLALANLSVECGDDSGAALNLPLEAIAEQFVRLYWRQVIPYAAAKNEVAGGAIVVADSEVGYGQGASDRILRQAPGMTAIVKRILPEHERVQGSLAKLSADKARWTKLLRQVSLTVRTMPLTYLQNVGGVADEFLYAKQRGSFSSVDLKPGVAFTLRRFHGLVQELVRGAWARYVSALAANRPILGNNEDLHEFLFGTERASLEDYRPILRKIQGTSCFYCETELADEGHVDHFIPWARYPVDLGHNFVLAHASCNLDKSDLLASVDHLEHWVERNSSSGAALLAAFAKRQLVADLDASRAVTRWAYQVAAQSGSRVWAARKKAPVALDPRWSSLL